MTMSFQLQNNLPSGVLECQMSEKSTSSIMLDIIVVKHCLSCILPFVTVYVSFIPFAILVFKQPSAGPWLSGLFYINNRPWNINF